MLTEKINISENFELEIITPRKVAAYLVGLIEIETTTGSFTIAKDHAPLVSCLKKKGLVTFQTNAGIAHTIHIENGGLFWISENKAQLILHQAQI